MRARYGHVEALLKIKTRDAVQAAFDHIMDMLRLCRSDNLGVRGVAPALFLRLGRDQECYDFIVWWTTTNSESRYDWGNIDLPYLDTKDADVFESVAGFTGRWPYLDHVVAVTLIKIRIFLELRDVRYAGMVGRKVPQELLDRIGEHLIGPHLTSRRDVIESDEKRPQLIRDVRAQIRGMYQVVNRANKYFWPALLKPGSNLTARPEYTGDGDPGQMQLALQHSYDAWIETPGALEEIRQLGLRNGAT